MHTTCNDRRFTSLLSLLLVSLAALLAGCGGPEAGALASIPLGLTYESGDRGNTIDGQMGLAAEPSGAKVDGGFGFVAKDPEQESATVSCGPHEDGFYLRFQPRGRTDVVLTLILPQEGGHGEAGAGHEQGLESEHGHASADAYRAGNAKARLVRFQGGELTELTGTAEVSKHATAHVAGRHAISGDFTATLEGTELTGSFSHCFYFPG